MRSLKIHLITLACLCIPLAARPVSELPAVGGKVRVIIDTDAANEIDDLYALALVLAMPERFDIEGIVAAHYGDFGGPHGIRVSYDLIKQMLEFAGREEIPVLKGSDPFQYVRKVEDSAGVDFIVKEAMDGEDERPLWVVSLGACTNISMAYVKQPKIAEKVISFWHGRTQWPERCWNFNAWNDLTAVQVMFNSELPLVLFDTGTYTRASMEETAERIAPHGKLGAYLHDYRSKRSGIRMRRRASSTWAISRCWRIRHSAPPKSMTCPKWTVISPTSIPASTGKCSVSIRSTTLRSGSFSPGNWKFSQKQSKTEFL